MMGMLVVLWAACAVFVLTESARWYQGLAIGGVLSLILVLGRVLPA